MKDKKRLKNCPRLEETKETQLLEIRSWNRKKAIGEKLENLNKHYSFNSTLIAILIL